jgi:hypothetical protein
MLLMCNERVEGVFGSRPEYRLSDELQGRELSALSETIVYSGRNRCHSGNDSLTASFHEIHGVVCILCDKSFHY